MITAPRDQEEEEVEEGVEEGVVEEGEAAVEEEEAPPMALPSQGASSISA